MDGAKKQTVSLAEAMETAWADCRRRLEATRGRLAGEIAEKAALATAMHMARRTREVLLADVPVRLADRRLRS